MILNAAGIELFANSLGSVEGLGDLFRQDVSRAATAAQPSVALAAVGSVTILGQPTRLSLSPTRLASHTHPGKMAGAAGGLSG
jgi:hypothetical protein